MSSLSEVSVTLTCYDSILPPTFSLFIVAIKLFKRSYVENVLTEINPSSCCPRLTLLLESNSKLKCHSLLYSESPKLCRPQQSHL